MPDDVTKGLGGTPPRKKPGSGKKFLLTIAIGKYDGRYGYGELQYPVPNAEGIAEELKRSYGFTEVFSICNQDCTKDNISKKILEVRNQAGADSQLIVFFTGHGAAASDDGYWIPINQEEEIELNCSVFGILQLLMNGSCSQVLLFVDCCFSGTAVDAAYPLALFKKEKFQDKVFSVITAGNKYEVVPDKSIFYDSLIDILRYSTIQSFNDLIVQLEQQLKYRGSKTKITHHSTVDQLGQQFLLQRDDRVSYELARSFLDLNYKDQSRDLTGITMFNMTYLRGSSNCGHQLFLHRYFEKNGKNISSIDDYPECKISFGGEHKSPGISIWQQLAIHFKLDPNQASANHIIKALMNVLMYNNFLITVIIKGSCIESEMEIALKDFWREIFIYATTNKEEVKRYSNRVYFFIWDKRGKAEGISDIVTKDKFQALLRSPYAKLLALPAIKEVEDDDFYDWHAKAKDEYEALPAAEEFRDLDFEMVKPPHTVMNVITQIEILCGCDKVLSKFFSSNKFSYND